MEIYGFGYRLREPGETCNLSQLQVAAYLDITRSAASNYERDLSCPSTEVLSKLTI